MDQQPRKGQTSLDFLMTYGWAVLLVVAVVASLFVLGVFNIGAFIGPRATGFSQLSVIAWNVNSAGDLALRLQNFAGMDINIVNIDASYGTSNYSFPITNVSIPNSKTSDTFTVGTISGLAPGQYYTLPLRITYVDLNGFNYTETGTISGTVGAGAVPPSIRINSPHSDSLLTNWTVNVSFTVTGANLSQANVSIINSSGVVDSDSRSSPGTYTVPLSVSSDGIYNITAIAYYNDGSNITANATNITVNTTAPVGLQCGDPLDQEGRTYILTGDVNSTSESCFDITAGGVTLDCNGSAITGPGSFYTGDGVSINGHNNVTVKNCIITGFEYGIHFTGAGYGAILNNTANSNNGHGIWLYSSSNSTIANNTASSNGNGGGIVLESGSDNNVVSNNTAGSDYIGIYFSSSPNNTIADNTASSNTYGIRLDSSSNNNATNNTANSNGNTGISLQSSSDNNTVANNTASLNTRGISLDSSSDNNIDNNNASNNTGAYNIILQGSSMNNTVSNNIANSNQNSYGEGIRIQDSSAYNTIMNNTAISNSYMGIHIYTNVHNNNIIGNTIVYGSDGITLDASSGNNNITGNNISSTGYGIWLWASHTNNLINNTLVSNNYGVRADSGSNGNRIYNNLFNNSHDAYSDGTPNLWNTTLDCGTDNLLGGPCVGGNFWAQPDGFGFSQNCTTNGSSNSSGICTVPYEIDGSNIDELPLTMNFTPSLETCGTGSTVGMISYWKFDEGAGANISDTMEDNNGTFGSPGPTWTTGQVGSALYFSGQYIDVGDPGGSLNISGHQLTMMAWINYTGSPNDNNGWIMGKMGPSTGSYGMYVRTNEGENNLSFCLDNGTGWTGAAGDTRVTTNEWHHVAAVYDGSQVKFYLDGVAETPVGMSGDIVPKPYSLKMGWEDGWNSQHFLGSMDELAIFNRSLGASEIQRMYQFGLSGQGYCNVSAPSQPPIGLSDCGNISYSGNYVLTDDVSNSDTCFTIEADNVTLDCNGRTITGSGSGVGVYNNGGNNVKVANCNITYFSQGIAVYYGASYGTIVNNTASSNSLWGIILGEGSNNNTIANNIVSSNPYMGIRISASSNNIISNNTVSANDEGITLYASSNDNLFYNNFLNNTDNLIDDGSYGTNSGNLWNTTLDCGTTSIIGGPCVGGNFWAQPDGNGWSENSTECNANASGICTSQYSIPGSSDVDYLPLTMLTPPPPTELSACGNISYSGNYILTGDVSNGGTCFTIEADNVTLDCNGSSITGPSSGYGIYNNGNDYVTVENCNISGFYHGVFFENGAYGNISNNNASSNDHAGIILQSSSNYNNIANNTASSNGNYGISLFYSSSYNNIANNTASNNTIYNIIFWPYCDYNTIANNTVSLSQYGGISLQQNSDNNIIANNTFSSNTADDIEFPVSSENNLIYNNLFNNTGSLQSYGSSNFWNTTLDCSGPSNIVGGPCVGGNFWAQPDGNGWSENATECGANSSGLCTWQYNITGSNIDYLPLTNLTPQAHLAMDGTVWVSNQGDDTVSRIDKSTNATIGDPISVGSYPFGISVDQDSVWVANTHDGTVSRINKTTNTNMINITVGSGPAGVAVDQDSVWVSNGWSDTVSRINKSTNEVVANITVGSGPSGIAVDSDSVWVANYYDNTIFRINKTDTSDITPIYSILHPWGVAIDQDSVWVANYFASGTVTRINRTTGDVIGSPIAVGAWPIGVAVDQDSVWVANQFSASVSRINKADTNDVEAIGVGSYPFNLGDATGYVYDMFFH